MRRPSLNPWTGLIYVILCVTEEWGFRSKNKHANSLAETSRKTASKIPRVNAWVGNAGSSMLQSQTGNDGRVGWDKSEGEGGENTW